MKETKEKDARVVGHEGLIAFDQRVFEKLGMPREDAAISPDALVRCNLRGVPFTL